MFDLFHSKLKTKDLFRYILSYKIILFLFIILSIKLLPIFYSPQFFANFHYPQDRTPSYSDHFKTWDGQIYIYIAEFGYTRSNAMPNAFYPLWPFTISLFSKIFFNNYLLAALILSNLFSLIALIILYKLIEKSISSNIAFLTITLMLFFPGSIFFNLPYSESLFFLLLVLFFYFLKEDNKIPLIIVSLLLPLTRVVGIFILFPLIYKFWHKNNKIKDYFIPLVPLIGFFVYMIIMFLLTGDALTGFKSQSLFAQNASIFKIFNLPSIIKSFFSIEVIHGYMNSALDRVFFLFACILLPFLWKNNKVYALFVIPSLLIPAFTSSFVSTIRFVSVLFPLFICLATLLDKREESTKILVVFIFIIIQILFMVLYINNYWVA